MHQGLVDYRETEPGSCPAKLAVANQSAKAWSVAWSWQAAAVGIIGTGQVDSALDDDVIDPAAGTSTRIDLVVAVQVQPCEAHQLWDPSRMDRSGWWKDRTGKRRQWCRNNCCTWLWSHSPSTQSARLGTLPETLLRR